MQPLDALEHVVADALDAYVLGALNAADTAALEQHLAEDPMLRTALANARVRIAAWQHALRAVSTPGAAVSDETLAAYLDDALDTNTRAQLEAQLSTDTQLVERLAALYRHVTNVTDSNSAVEWREKFLAGETLAFERPNSSLTIYEKTGYVDLEQALEARKRRYLHG